MEITNQIPWRRIANSTTLVCGILLAVYIGLQTAYAVDFDMTRRTAYLHVAEQLKSVMGGTIEFFKPFVQAVLLLALGSWAVRRFHVRLDQFSLQQVGTEKLVVSLLVGGFVFVALKGGVDSLVYLKDLALVALGFYFGWVKR